MSLSDVLLYIVQQKLTVSSIILLTLPVSVASRERRFSKLKLIKTYLRSTMSQRSLVDLATSSIEYDYASTLEWKELVETFTMKKARKIKL